MARDALCVLPARSHRPHTAKSYHRSRVRFGVGHTVLPAGLLVAYVTPTQHHHIGGTTVPLVGYYGPDRRSIVVPEMPPSALANLQPYEICTEASNGKAILQAATDPAGDPITGGNLGSSTARGRAIEGGDL